MTLCVVCDSTARPCPQHPQAARYIEPAVYTRCEHGWVVSDNERDEWALRPLPVDRPAKYSPEARTLQQLMVELEAWVFLSGSLEATVRAAHSVNALRTTRLVEKVVAGAQDGSLNNAEGYLAKHSATIAARSEAA